MHKYEVRVDSKLLGRVRFGFLLKASIHTYHRFVEENKNSISLKTL